MNKLPQRPATLDWLPALQQPQLALSWTLGEWERVVRIGRPLRLVARLAEALTDAGLLDQVPLPAQRQLRAQLYLSRWRTAATAWTAEHVASAIGDAATPLVLLKGAAYVAQGVPIAKGRLPSDLDILVPRQAVEHAQQRLNSAGWVSAPLDEHDARYYREWSHEVPPMGHPIHPVELDLHHDILPPVAATHVDIGLMLAQVQPSGWPGWYVFAPIDQVLHSAAHLFLDSELGDRVRDLVDLDGLLRHFGARDGFWDQLLPRANELGLIEPLALALHFARHWLGTPVPATVLSAVDRDGPSSARRAWLFPLFGRVLSPAEPDAPPLRGQGLASIVVLTRYHWHRLPLHLLVPHLWRKWRKRQATDTNTVSNEPRA